MVRVMTMMIMFVGGDSGGIGEGCNGDCGGGGGSHVNKAEPVTTEDYSQETILVSNKFPLSIHLIIKERPGTQ